MAASAPRDPVEVPDAVRARVRDAGGLEAVWRNELGGLTFRDGDRYLKWNPAGTGLSLAAEVERMRWADLAVASTNLEVDFGPGWRDEFFAAYGIRPDADRIRFSLALWDAGD